MTASLVSTGFQALMMVSLAIVVSGATMCAAIAKRFGWHPLKGVAIGLIPIPLFTWCVTWYVASRMGEAGANGGGETDSASLSLPADFFD